MTTSSTLFTPHRFKTLLAALTVTTLTGLAVTPAHAQGLTATPSSQTTEKIRERIERVVEEKRDQVKGVLSDLTQRRKAFVGEVQRVSTEAITISTSKGTQIVPLDNEVKITKKGALISVDDIAVGDWAIVIGGIQDDDFHPGHVIISAASLRPKTKVLTLGTITKITKTDLAVTSRQDGTIRTYQLDKSTAYQNAAGDKIEASKLSEDIQCLIIGVQDGTTLKARVVKTLAP